MTASDKHIMMVDDNPQLLEFLDYRLKALGYRTTTLNGGEAALERILHDPPQLVILDVTMPEINGYQLCREIKAHDKRIPIIILTAKADPADRFWAAQAGADAFLNKPIEPSAVIERVAALLART